MSAIVIQRFQSAVRSLLGLRCAIRISQSYTTASPNSLPTSPSTTNDENQQHHHQQPQPPKKTYPSAKEAQQKRQPIHLLDADLEEKFVKGGGPGGQKINKARSSVQLRHLPTGLFVEEARKLLTLKLDDLINGEYSKNAVSAAKYRKSAAKREQRSKKKYGAAASAAAEPSSSDSSDEAHPPSSETPSKQ
eukprot:jgi/Hompol1/4039/HPOL_003461-RA